MLLGHSPDKKKNAAVKRYMWMRKNNQRKGEKLGVGTATHTPKEKMRHREEVQKKRKAEPSVCKKEARLLKRCECKGRSMVALRLQTMPQQISARRCSSFVTAWLNSTSLWKNEKKKEGHLPETIWPTTKWQGESLVMRVRERERDKNKVGD